MQIANVCDPPCRQGAGGDQHPRRAIRCGAGQGRDPAAAGRSAALRKLELTHVGGRRADRSITDHRPGRQRRLLLARDRMLAMQDKARRRPRRAAPPADDVCPRPGRAAPLQQVC